MPNPSILNGPYAWKGENIVKSTRWKLEFHDSDIDDIEQALGVFKAGKNSLSLVSKETFPLTSFNSKLAYISNELEEGCGCVRLRGLPIKRWSFDDVRLIWMGIASYIGAPVYQNPQGQIIRTISAEKGDIGKRYGQLGTSNGKFLSSRARTASNAELRFHTDRCDVVGLLCTGQAETGGESRIASSVSVHNEMLKRAPELCKLFYDNLPRSRIGEEKDGESQWYELPVWGVKQGKFTSHYSRTYIEALEYVKDAPKVSEAQWRAMDLLSDLAFELSLAMTLQPGDIQFLNNHVVYHSRNAFQDNPQNGRFRSLERIWLSAPHRRLPEDHRVLWREVEPGKIRGGISLAT